MLKDFTQERFDIILQAGQSNAEGCGCGPVDEPYQPKDTVWYLDSDFTITKAKEQVRENEIRGDFSLSFADRYLQEGLLEDGRSLLIIRSSVGGTGFTDHRWGMTDDLYLRMMEMVRTALALNPENRLVAFLWHQGENDVNKKQSYKPHYDNLSTLLASVREEFNVPKLPFVAGDFVPLWKQDKEEACAEIVNAMIDVCKNLGCGKFVTTEGLLSNYEELGRPTLNWLDNIHFSRKSLYELGNRYYDAFLEIKNDK